MRILFVTSKAFFPEHVCGQNRTLLELALALEGQGHEPVVLSGTASIQKQTKVIGERGYGFRLFRADHPLTALAAISVALRPDAVVVVDGDYEALTRECRSLKVPVAIWFFEAEAYFFRDTALDDSLLYLATSRFLAGRLTGLFGIEAEVVAPFIDQDRYRVPHQGSRVLFVNPVREKGVEIALSLAQRRPSIPFTFVESWGISEQWRKNCFGRALQSGNVEWVIRTMDIGPVLDRTRVLLAPRASEEGFCRLVTEAQLGGIPVLAAKRGNLTENVGAGGTTVDLDADTDVWLESLDRFFDDADFYARTSEQARQHATRTDISGAQVIERLLQLLTICIEHYRARRFGSLR